MNASEWVSVPGRQEARPRRDGEPASTMGVKFAARSRSREQQGACPPGATPDPGLRRPVGMLTRSNQPSAPLESPPVVGAQGNAEKSAIADPPAR